MNIRYFALQYFMLRLILATDSGIKHIRSNEEITNITLSKIMRPKKDHAALFSKPRIFPFFDHLFNPMPVVEDPIPPTTYPMPPATAGGGSISFGNNPYHSSNSKPSCALNGLYCLYDNSYPSDKVDPIVERFYTDVKDIYSTLHRVPMSDLFYDDNKTHKFREKGHFVCETRVKYVKLGWARSVKGQWLVIINTNTFPQTVRVEECKYANRRCEYLPPCYKSICVQRFSFQKFLCVDPLRPTSKPFIEIFEIPSACSCFVENFIYY